MTQSTGRVRKLRDVVVLIAVATAFAFSLVFLRRAVGVASPWFGLMVMLDFLGLVGFARPLFLLRLPTFLREVHPRETNGALYKALRVPVFGALLRRTPLRLLNPTVYLSGDPCDSSVVLAQLESAEAAHHVAAVLLFPYIVYAYVQGRLSALAWLMFVQIGFNLYPVLHLRWARIRLNRLHERMLSHRIERQSSPAAHLARQAALRSEESSAASTSAHRV